MHSISIRRFRLSLYGEPEGKAPATRQFCYCYIPDFEERTWNLCWNTAWFWLALTFGYEPRA